MSLGESTLGGQDASISPAREQAGDSVGYRLVVLAILFLFYGLNYLDRQIIAILATPIKLELGLTDTQLGLLGGFAFAILYSTLALPVAWLADRTRRTTIMAIAIAVWSGFTALCGTATSFASLFLYRLGVGVGEAGGSAPSYSLVSDYFPPQQRARALAVMLCGLPIGSAAGLMIGGVIAVEHGWRAAFIGVGLFGLVVPPLLWLVVREPKRGRFDPGYDARPVAAPPFRQVIAHIASRPSFWLLSLGIATTGMLHFGLSFWLPAFFQRSHGLDLLTTSRLVAALALIAGLLGILGSGFLSDRLAKGRPQYYAFVPAAAFLVALPLLAAALWAGDTRLAFLLFIIPQACSLMGGSPVGVAIQHLGSPAMRTTIVAAHLLVVNLIGVGAGSFVIGFISDTLAGQFGQESLRYSMLATGLLLCPLAALWLVLAGWRLPRDQYVAPAAEAVP